MRTRFLRIALIVCVLLGILGGCATYQGDRIRPAEYYRDGKPVPGNYRVESVFQF